MRHCAASGLIALLVAVFPANVQMLISAHQAQAPHWWQVILWLRLPLQPVLIGLMSRQARRRDR